MRFSDFAMIMALLAVVYYFINKSNNGTSEVWRCEVTGDVMYSINESGKIAGAQKGCSCEQIKRFEIKQFGRVDEQALKSDFGCY